jgi:flavin-binding protein dodecin
MAQWLAMKRMEVSMAEHVYKIVELVGSSRTTIEDAVQNALSKAGESVRNMRWFTVAETRGYIDEGKVAYWQVTIKLGFTVEE